jgi:DNA-damage-inducible protein J
MATTNITIRMDQELKKQFDHFCDEIGMSMITLFYQTASK